MKSSLLALAALFLPLAASAAVTVEWVSPDTYKDAYSSSMKSDKSRQVVLDDLQKFIEAQAATKLAEGQSLKISVTDIDLAGEYEPWTEHKDVRMVKGAYFGRINFDYVLTDADGEVVKEGSANIVNNLLISPSMPDKDEIAPYLRDSLRDWFRSNL